MTDGTLGSEREPEVREDVGGRGRTRSRPGSYSGDQRRFDCTTCLRDDPDGHGEGSKLIDAATARGERGHVEPIRTVCRECDGQRWHVPAGGRPLAYYRLLGALRRRREGGASA